MLLFIFFSLTLSCGERTKTFNSHGLSNENGYYFVKDTYSASLDKCTSISNVNFRKKINENMPCNYKHCVPNIKWNCIYGNSRDCYNVEHIIPKVHNIDELNGCNVDIAGNLIMSYGVWNQELSNSFYEEKKLIYGEIFNEAYKNIYKCCKGKLPEKIPVPNCGTNFPTSSPEPNYEKLPVSYIIILVVFLVAIALICGFMVLKLRGM